VPYREPSRPELDAQHKDRLLMRMRQQIERLGYTVTTAPVTARAA
jgi:hypothetical protein